MTRIERLRGEVELESAAAPSQFAADLAWLLDSHAELVRALEPIADEADHRCVDNTEWSPSHTVVAILTIGNLRRARTALTNAKETDNAPHQQ